MTLYVYKLFVVYVFKSMDAITTSNKSETGIKIVN